MFFVLPLNAEPWAIGSLGYNPKARRPYIGPNHQLDSYKEAVQVGMVQKYPNLEIVNGDIELWFYFWRQRAQYENKDTGRFVTKNEVDTTNLQKATEDALQGVLYPNDKRVRRIHSTLVEQDTETIPTLVIRLEPYAGIDETELPSAVWAEINNTEELNFDGPGTWL